jgi:PhnB protein
VARLAQVETSVVPELSVRRGREAVEFYKAAFGAVEVYRVGGTDEHAAVVSQLSIGG